MVLLVFMFFVFMIQAAVITTSLQSAAMNAVKQVSAHLYPVSLLAVQSAGGMEMFRESRANGSLQPRE